MPHISIVVCTHNRAQGLANSLRSLTHLLTQDEFSYDVLVVDNASQDDTAQVITKMAEDYPVPLRGVYEGRKGVVYARNRGIVETTGDWVAFFDDDQEADPRWLLELLHLALEKKTRCVGGAVWLKLPADQAHRQLTAKVRMLLGEARWSDKPMAYTPKIGPGAGNLMIQRTLFTEAGGFDENILGRGEDTDLYFRICALGETCWFSPAAIIHHVIPEARLTEIFFRRLSIGMGEGVAMHEMTKYGAAKFSLIWTGKILRAVLLDGPLYWMAKLTGSREQALERICRISLEQGHMQNGWRLLKAAWSQPRDQHRNRFSKPIVSS